MELIVYLVENMLNSTEITLSILFTIRLGLEKLQLENQRILSKPSPVKTHFCRDLRNVIEIG